MVTRVGIDHVGEPAGLSRVAEAGPCSTNPNNARVGEPGGNRTHNPQMLNLRGQPDLGRVGRWPHN